MKLLIVIPAYNEEKIIRQNALALLDFMQNNFSGHDWTILVSDNNSTDRTQEIAKELCKKNQRVQYFFVKEKGKGAAIKSAWLARDADIFCFMDADLSTDFSSLPQLIRAVAVEGFDVSYGSRFHLESRVSRAWIRKAMSFGYRAFLKIILRTKINDAPCGFKAINKKIRDEVLPRVENTGWFFDSELILLSERLGYKIKEIPIVWKDKEKETGRKSQVRILSLSFEYAKRVLDLRKRLKKF